MPIPPAPKPTPDLLTHLPMRVTLPTVWNTIRFPGVEWLTDQGGCRAHGVTEASTLLVADNWKRWRDLTSWAKAEAATTDWTKASGEKLVYVAATAEGLYQAIRRFGPAPLPDDGSRDEEPEFEARASCYMLRLTESDVIPREYLPLVDAEESPMLALIGQLNYVLYAHVAAKAEIDRREQEHPEMEAAWEVVRSRNPGVPGIEARAALDYFGNLFAGHGEEGRKLLGAMFKRHLAATHGVPATRQGLEGLLWSEFLLTLTKQWDRDELSDFGVLAAALDGDLKRLHWAIYDDLRDEARHEERRPAVEDVNLPRRPVKPSGLASCPQCGHEARPPFVCPGCGVGVPKDA